MKNSMIVRLSALILSVLVMLSLFTVWASAADQKQVYDDEYTDVFYLDGVFTFEVDAERIGEILTNHEFNKSAILGLLPDGISDIIETRSKASVINFLVNLVEKDILTYDELLTLFKGNKEVLERYINIELLKDLAGKNNPYIQSLFDKLMVENKLDAVLENKDLQEKLLTEEAVNTLLSGNEEALADLLTEDVLSLLFGEDKVTKELILNLNDEGYLQDIVDKEALVVLLDDIDKAKLLQMNTPSFDDVLDLVLQDKYSSKWATVIVPSDVVAKVPLTFIYGYIDVSKLIDEVGHQALIDAVGGFDKVMSAVGGYDAVIDAMIDLELTGMLSIEDLWNHADIAGIIRAAGGSVVNAKLRAFFLNVLFNEVNVMSLNGTVIYDGVNFEFDHNAIQTAVLQAMPSVEEVSKIKDCDELFNFAFTTEGDDVNLDFGVKVVLKGDCSVINDYAAKFVNILFYTVEDSGTINVNVDLDARFAGIYSDVLSTDQLTEERKLELLGLYTKNGKELTAELEKEDFEELKILAEIAKKGAGELAETYKETIEKLKEYLVKAAGKSATAEAFTSIADCYLGDGEFFLHIHEEIALKTITDKITSRVNIPEEWLDYLKQDDHVEDIKLAVSIEDFYRVRYYDAEGNLLYLTFLPVGEDLAFLNASDELTGYGENGWYDSETATETTVMPAKDVDLYEHVHEYGAWESDGADTHSRTCSCGDKQTAAHTWNAGEVTKPATHTEEGVKTYTCTECGETKTETIPKTTEHTYGDWKHDDEKHWKECACGERAEEGAHVYDNDKDADCNVCGYERQLPPPGGSSYKWAIIATLSLTMLAGCTIFAVRRKKENV